MESLRRRSARRRSGKAWWFSVPLGLAIVVSGMTLLGHNMVTFQGGWTYHSGTSSADMESPALAAMLSAALKGGGSDRWTCLQSKLPLLLFQAIHSLIRCPLHKLSLLDEAGHHPHSQHQPRYLLNTSWSTDPMLGQITTDLYLTHDVTVYVMPPKPDYDPREGNLVDYLMLGFIEHPRSVNAARRGSVERLTTAYAFACVCVFSVLRNYCYCCCFLPVPHTRKRILGLSWLRTRRTQMCSSQSPRGPMIPLCSGKGKR